MRLLAEIIGWTVLGAFALALIFLIVMVMWSSIEEDLWEIRNNRYEKKSRKQAKESKINKQL